MACPHAQTTPLRFWEQGYAVCILTTSPPHETVFLRLLLRESQVGLATKISFYIAPLSFFFFLSSMIQMRFQWLVLGESNLKTKLHCSSFSVNPWAQTPVLHAGGWLLLEMCSSTNSSSSSGHSITAWGLMCSCSMGPCVPAFCQGWSTALCLRSFPSLLACLLNWYI